MLASEVALGDTIEVQSVGLCKAMLGTEMPRQKSADLPAQAADALGRYMFAALSTRDWAAQYTPMGSCTSGTKGGAVPVLQFCVANASVYVGHRS